MVTGGVLRKASTAKVKPEPEKEAPEIDDEDYIPTEKEEELQKSLQEFALDLLDDNPSWANKVIIQNLVIWEFIDPVVPLPGSKKGKKKYKKVKKRSSGLDFGRKNSSKSRDASRAITPEPSVVKPVTYTLDNVIAESSKWVIDKGAGETILQRAAKMGYPDVAAYAVEVVKMNPGLKDNAGIPPIHKAAFKGHADIVEILLKHGVDPNTNVKGTRPLHEALESGEIMAVYHLLRYGADPLLYDYSGNMPIDLTEDDPEMKRYLAALLADLHGKPAERWNVEHDPKFVMPPDMLKRSDEVEDDDEEASSDDEEDDFIFESSSQPLPAYFQFKEREGKFVMVADLLKSGGKVDAKKTEVLEMTWEDFNKSAHCCLLGHVIPESVRREDKVKLVKVESPVKKQLGIESSPVKRKIDF